MHKFYACYGSGRHISAKKNVVILILEKTFFAFIPAKEIILCSPDTHNIVIVRSPGQKKVTVRSCMVFHSNKKLTQI